MLHNAVERAASAANSEESGMPKLNVVTGATGACICLADRQPNE
jgi:hypothetical protein